MTPLQQSLKDDPVIGAYWDEILAEAGMTDEEALNIEFASEESDRFTQAEVKICRKYNLRNDNTLWDKVAAMYRYRRD